MPPSLEALDASTFREHLHSPFELRHDGASVALQLIEVELLGEAPTADRQSFSLIFLGPTTPALPQSTYSMQHQRLGQLALFIVPIASDARGVRYEAVFN